MDKQEKKIVAYQVSFILMALYFSLMEMMIPKPFPWMKIGLSNIATIIAIEYLGFKRGVEVFLLRVLISSFMVGSLFTPGFFISIGSGSVSIIVTGILFLFRKKLSLISISSFSGMVHNGAQLMIVYLLLFRNIDCYNREIMIFVLVFLFIGVLAGGVTGFLAEKFRIEN